MERRIEHGTREKEADATTIPSVAFFLSTKSEKNNNSFRKIQVKVGRINYCLAFQNAMAAQINGHTVHHWSGIPARNDDGNAMGDRHKQSMKCVALRVIIIDEV